MGEAMAAGDGGGSIAPALVSVSAPASPGSSAGRSEQAEVGKSRGKDARGRSNLFGAARAMPEAREPRPPRQAEFWQDEIVQLLRAPLQYLFARITGNLFARTLNIYSHAVPTPPAPRPTPSAPLRSAPPGPRWRRNRRVRSYK